ncbi:MarP family serine protease [Gordonia hankookensis]|uniref:MarP family serine protease n=1 Tax=Gordonia hankookensis TaxID=589403 RepID=A0ABR7WHW0_9ACTN|nr:MarP family serine protease [Gordonia hankookensis]MBD1322353.1 MarP family serine protease [Gordonia hankookensis]NDZ97703.1 MarP family serine protease [Streptomyces sp. SID11726]NEB26826.1 MarP family serine protease [Streptomyces sp. SID6673]
MSGSGWVDLIVVVIAVLAAASGYRQGAVASALAFLGVILGAVAGILLAPHIISRFDDSTVRLLVGVVLLVALIIVGEVSGMILGRAARSGIRSRGVRRIDSVIGLVLQVIAVLVAAWLLAIPLSSSTETQLSTAVRGSKVLGGVDVFAPQWLRDLPRDFSALLDNSGLPQVIGPFGRTPVVNVGPPDPSVVQLPVVNQTRPSVMKIEGTAPSCRQALEGSGFVVSPERVMTNAHVVAGTRRLTVSAPSGQQLPARVVLFDSSNDIAVLDVPGLTAPPLKFADKEASPGDDAIVLGYPEAGPFAVNPVRVREVINLSGPDIYRTGRILREVYTVRGQIRQGNSGGPMINSDGEVLGVVFGAAEDTADQTGFVLTAKQVQSNFTDSENRSSRVSTQSCVHA